MQNPAMSAALGAERQSGGGEGGALSVIVGALGTEDPAAIMAFLEQAMMEAQALMQGGGGEAPVDPAMAGGAPPPGMPPV